MFSFLILALTPQTNQTPSTVTTPAQENVNNVSLEAIETEGDTSFRKSSKKKHKEKHKHKHHKHHDKEKHKDKHQHQIKSEKTNNANHLANHGITTPMLELRVPKLIVRKITVKDGNQERETMEVYSPEKKKQFKDVITGEDYVRY